MRPGRSLLFLLLFPLPSLLAPGSAEPAPEGPLGLELGRVETDLHVDPAKGKDDWAGSRRRPFATIQGAIASLPEPLVESVTLRLAAGLHGRSGAGDAEEALRLALRMRPGVSVTLTGPAPSEDPAVLDWRSGRLIEVHEGTWTFEHLVVGSFETSQRRGVLVRGPARVVLDTLSFHLRSESDVAVRAEDGGHVFLRGAIRVNAELADEAPPESYSGFLAVDHGIIEFDEHDGASLVMGNGSLRSRTYGRIRLGCESARITCWTKSNNLSIANSGRIDLANTPTTLVAKRKNNTPIGLEHDGHVLAEDTQITIVGPNDSAIALQKSSTFTCNDIELVGEFEVGLWASSGSMFVGRFLTDVPKLKAMTGASILVEAIDGEVGEIVVESGGLVTVPGRVVRSQ